MGIDGAPASGFGADLPDEVDGFVPADIRQRYEVHSYRHAAAILSTTANAEYQEILQALRQFRLPRDWIVAAGGNESLIPKAFSQLLRPLHWYETRVGGDLVVRRTVYRSDGKLVEESLRPNYLDGHKVDYVKQRVAFDLEWNSKDQTFDRDLYAARAFHECGLISAAILVTRSADLNPVFAKLGVAHKYGASTTWMGKLLPRLDAGRAGGCPVLAFGMRQGVLIDESP